MMNLTTRRAAAAAMFAGLAVSTASAQIFQREVGDFNEETSFSIGATRDGGNVAAGFKRSPNGDLDFHIIKYFADGTTEWETIFGGDRDDVAYSVQQTDDGGYIVAGESLSFEAGFEIVLLRLDAGGSQIWSNAYQGSYMADPIHTPHPGVALDQDPEGNIYVVGHRADPTTFPTRPVAFRTDPAGGLAWYNDYGVPTLFQDFADLAFTDIAFSEADRTVVISGTVRSEGPLDPDDPTFLGPVQDAILMKVVAGFNAGAPAGTPVWLNRYDSVFDRDSPDLPNVWETGDGLDVFGDGEIILAGRTDLGLNGAGFPGPYTATHLVRTDPSGFPVVSSDYETFSADGVAVAVQTAYAAVEYDTRLDAFVQAGRVTRFGLNGHTQLSDAGLAPIWAWRYGLDDVRSRLESVQPSVECGYSYAGRIDNSGAPAPLGAGDHYHVSNNDMGETGCLEERLGVEMVAPLSPRQLPFIFERAGAFFELPKLARPVDGFNFALCFDPDCDPGTGPCNAADIAPPFGVLDLDDVNAFIVAFFAMTPAADIAPPFGVWDLDDINLFIAAFLAGCP